MEVLFKNKTQYTKDVYNEYLEFHRNKFGFKYNVSTIAIAFLLLFCIIFNIKQNNIGAMFLFIIGIFLLIWYRFIYPNKMIADELKSEKFDNEIEFTFVFYNDHFTLLYRGGRKKIKYSNVYKVFESTNYIYLYTDDNHAFLLDKRNFLIGDSENFYKFIKKKIRFRIKVKKSI